MEPPPLAMDAMDARRGSGTSAGPLRSVAVAPVTPSHRGAAPKPLASPPRSPRAPTVPGSPTGPAGDRFKHYDEHVVAIEELERRYDTNRLSGLLAHVVSRSQNEHPRLNLLPTDADVGHGSIHELVAVLRDGSWIHTRAENLLVGDVIGLKEGQCVPADVRLLECEHMTVDQRGLFGTAREHRAPVGRHASSVTPFDAAEAPAPYLESPNMAFYGTTVTSGSGKAIVVRTGEDTVLGGIAAKLLLCRRAAPKHPDVPLGEGMRQLEVFCKNDHLPEAINRLSALVVEHSEVVKRSIIAASFGVHPPIVIELEDPLLANESATDELEREITVQIATHAQTNSDAQHFMKALAACRHRVENMSNGAGNNAGPTSARPPEQQRVPSMPANSPIAAPLVIDPVRDQTAILRFSANFGASSPKNSMFRKARCSTLLHGQISGCEVYVHFDQEHGAHVVLLQGPAREILSRCGKVRRGEAVEPLETSDLQHLQAMVQDLESRNQTVVSFAELYLDPSIYPVGVKFDIENFNFPTSNMCYLGSLGLIEKIQPEVMLMGSFARASDVRLLIAGSDHEYPVDDSLGVAADEDIYGPSLSGADDGVHDECARVQSVCTIPVRLREAASGEVVELEACVFRSNVLSISNTLAQWKEILLKYPVVIFDGVDTSQIDLLVETLQELGECVGLVASGSANALALATADVGFAIPSQDFVDLGEDAADVVLASSMCPRSDAIRLIEMAKNVRRRDNLRLSEPQNVAQAKTLLSNLFRESLAVGRMLGLNDPELKEAFDQTMSESTAGVQTNPLFPPPSPSKFPASAFRNTAFLSTNPRVGAAALSAGVAGVGPSAAASLSSV